MSGQSGHILLVEDDPIHLKVLVLNLTRAGFTVATAALAVRALSLVRNQRFDLAIVDYHLPDYPGTDFIKLLRNTDGCESTPVILLTARADELNLPRLRDELSVLVMPKPCSMDALLNTVSKCVAQAQGAY